MFKALSGGRGLRAAIILSAVAAIFLVAALPLALIAAPAGSAIALVPLALGDFGPALHAALPISPVDLGTALHTTLPAGSDLAIIAALGATRMVSGRVLSDFSLEGLQYRCDQVVKIDADAAKRLGEAGMLDLHKDAVSYALSQNGGKVIEHVDAAERAADEARAALRADIDALAAQEAAETDAEKKAALGTQLTAAREALAAAT